jgi:serine/threonine-protein kinase
MMPNRQLGKYTILEELGRGGFGTVYRATDNVLDREVAIKLLHPQLMVEMNFAERFRKEAKLVARIEHSNIVTIYDLGEQEGRVYIAMRFLPGGSLRDRLNKSGRIPFGQALEILRQVGAGLSAAHAKGLIHRDIKPENILFGEAGQAVIADFGLAKAIQSSSSSSFGGLGTPGYRAPELWRGKPPAGQATDEYALACVFTEMLTGEHLFAGDTPDEIITKHLVDGPVFPKNWPEGVPQGISTVIEKALAKDPSERYQGVDGFIAALDDLEREKDKQKKELISQEMQKQAWKEAQEREQHAAEIVRLQLEIKTALVREEWLKAKQEIFELKNLGPEAIVAVQEETVGEVRALMLAARRLEEGGYLEEAIEIYHLAQELAVSDPTLGLLTNEVNSLLQNLDARRRKELLVRAIPFSSAQKDPFSPSQSAATEDNSSHNGKGWIWILVIVGLIVAGLIGLNISQRQAEEHRLATEVAQEYASQSTATKQAYASQSTATASSAQATLISQKSRGIIIFGPESGTITQDPNDNANAMFSSGVALKNFIAEVEMHNPYSTAENPWSYSIDFRETHTNYAFYLGIDSNANWTLLLDDNGNWSTISHGYLYNLDTSVNGSNHIRLMMVDNVATFFLNNEFINTLDVSRNTMSGDVALVASTEIAGKTTPYSNFTVWAIP